MTKKKTTTRMQSHATAETRVEHDDPKSTPGIPCTYCHSYQTSVVKTFPYVPVDQWPIAGIKRRRHRCADCGRVFHSRQEFQVGDPGARD